MVLTWWNEEDDDHRREAGRVGFSLFLSLVNETDDEDD